MKLLFERLRSRRLASAFMLLATLSVAVVAGSFAAHGVRGQEKQSDSNDAAPLKVVNSPTPPNDFVRIAKLVGPAVVNINTQTLPKQSAVPGRRNPHTRTQPNDQNPGGDDQDNGQQPPDNFQDFFNALLRWSGPRSGLMQAVTTARSRRRSVQVSSLTPRATSLPITGRRQGRQDLCQAFDRSGYAGSRPSRPRHRRR